MKYICVYRCQLCNQLLSYGEPQEIPKEALMEVSNRVITNQRFAGNPYLYCAQLEIPHMCADDNCGMTYFAGFKQVK